MILQAILNNIVFARAYTHEHQMELLDGVAAQLRVERNRTEIVSYLQDSVLPANEVLPRARSVQTAHHRLDHFALPS